MMLFPTETLRSDSGVEGEYKWEVRVCRANLQAKYNLRAVIDIYRIKERRFFPDGSRKVYSTSNMVKGSGPDDSVIDSIEEARGLAERFDTGRENVEGIEV